MRHLILRLCLAGAAAFGLAACDDKPAFDFEIVAGSENKILEPMVQEFCADQGVNCHISYLGSLDIGLSLRQGQEATVDAVWPAFSIWIDLFDSARRVTHAKSISQNPVVLGIRKSKAEALGWTGKPVSTADILAAVDARDLRFLMTSATQSNSGASAYLAMLAAARGKPVLEAEDLDDPATLDQVTRLLRGVERSSGSSGWLGELYVESAKNGIVYDAMWNYEAVLKEVNDTLRGRGEEPLWAVYPTDGVAIADSPLGFLERGRGREVEAFFIALQDYLLSAETQARIAVTGRRIALGRADQAPAEPDWNFDPSRLVTAAQMPEAPVIYKALTLYQEALRRPSLTALCLDFSGSMEGEGESALRHAVSFLFSPERASEVLVQWSSKDRIFVMPFSGQVTDIWIGTGGTDDQAKLLDEVMRQPVGGGTDMYACAQMAFTQMAPLIAADDYLPAIVIMTDGQSSGDPVQFLASRSDAEKRIPIFGITFGNADRQQLEVLAGATGARVFDGTKDLTGAFRSARGYN
ncbi:VWA domain-containing protein [Zavarzinia compransoris]|uniref:substrate-binding domain-containing protein n=1 Tax=Zavarzinia marina TaxID=2911065 RepID=UPI001F3E4F90|nr:substrate-binding domain-containing protein [Zavarzinia marina]MCF4165318.1 VWA domain-containing protein [Zavarzinia marina]